MMIVTPDNTTLQEGIDAAARMHRDATIANDAREIRLATALLAILSELKRRAG